jgi:hypothetical protein
MRQLRVGMQTLATASCIRPKFSKMKRLVLPSCAALKAGNPARAALENPHSRLPCALGYALVFG